MSAIILVLWLLLLCSDPLKRIDQGIEAWERYRTLRRSHRSIS